MLGYTKEDIEHMRNAIHDAKLFYLSNEEDMYLQDSPIVEGLLKVQDFLQGLLEEGHIE
jgi:hypothetical protein